MAQSVGLINIFIQVTNNLSWRTLKALPKPPKTTANYKNLLPAKSPSVFPRFRAENRFFFGPYSAPKDIPINVPGDS